MRLKIVETSDSARHAEAIRKQASLSSQQSIPSFDTTTITIPVLDSPISPLDSDVFSDEEEDMPDRKQTISE